MAAVMELQLLLIGLAHWRIGLETVSERAVLIIIISAGSE